MLELTIIGNLGQDAEVKEFSGVKYASFNVAHSNAHNGNTTTQWVSCLYKGENVVPYLKKGTKVYARGSMKLVEKDGKTFVNMNVFTLELLGSKQADEQPQPTQANKHVQATQQTRPTPPVPEDNDTLPF